MATFCWHCGVALQERPDGSLIYKELTDPIGNRVRVHLSCEAGAGNTFKVWKDEGRRANGKTKSGIPEDE